MWILPYLGVKLSLLQLIEKEEDNAYKWRKGIEGIEKTNWRNC